jgi:hypothetical protein
LGSPKFASVAGLVGWQFNRDLGAVKFSTRGDDLFNKMSTQINFNCEGIWLGGSGRYPVGDSFTVRGEGRYMFNQDNRTTQTITTLGVGASPGVRDFQGYYAAYLIDGSGAFQWAPGLSVIGGLRYDWFGVKLVNPPAIAFFSNNADEGDFKVGSIMPYVGCEFVVSGCNVDLMLRAIGSPWITTEYRFGMTFGDPTGLPQIRDETNASSKYAAFYELSLHGAMAMGSSFTVGAFYSLHTMFAHGESEMQSVRLAGPVESFTSRYDMDFYRMAHTVGLNGAVAFNLGGCF